MLSRKVYDSLPEETRMRMNEGMGQLDADLNSRREMNFWVTTLDQYLSRLIYPNFAVTLVDNEDDLYCGK